MKFGKRKEGSSLHYILNVSVGREVPLQSRHVVTDPLAHLAPVSLVGHLNH